MIPVVTDPKKAAGSLNWAVTDYDGPLSINLPKSVREDIEEL